MEAIYNIYGYLKHHNRSTMVFDDAMIDWKDTDFNHNDRTDLYHEAKENIPSNALVPRGNPVQINAFVDANHARNRVTRRSHTGILIHLNTAPILWVFQGSDNSRNFYFRFRICCYVHCC
jgi:hypothetical protein